MENEQSTAMHVVPSLRLLPPPPNYAYRDNTEYTPSSSGKHESYDTSDHHRPDEYPPQSHPNSPDRPRRKNKKPPKKYYGKRRPAPGYRQRQRRPHHKERHQESEEHHDDDDGSHASHAGEREEESDHPSSSGYDHTPSRYHDDDRNENDDHVPVAASIVYGREEDEGGPRYTSPYHGENDEGRYSPYHSEDDERHHSSHDERDGGSSSPTSKQKSVYQDVSFRPVVGPFVRGVHSGAVHHGSPRIAEESNLGFTKVGPENTMPSFDSFGDFAPPKFST